MTRLLRPLSALRTPLRRTAGVAVLALVVSPLAACGSSANSAGATDSSGASSGAASSTDSSDVGTASSSTPSSSTSSVPEGRVSAADFIDVYRQALAKATTAKVSLSGKGGPAQTSGSGVQDFTTDPPSAEFHITAAGTKATVIAIGATSYVSTGQGKYLELDLGKVLGGATSLFDPQQALPLLQKSIIKVTHVGTTSVDGQSLDHYTASVDAKKVLSATLGKTTSIPLSGIPATFTEDVYFDGEGRVAELMSDEGKLGTQTIEYSDWGTKVDIVKPPAKDITSAPSGLPTS